MGEIQNAQNPWEDDLDNLDLSRAALFSKDEWRPYFKRFRDESPVHFHADSRFGPYWSITRFDDIVAVDKNNGQFSSAQGITIVDSETGLPVRSFITSDQPSHGPARKAVQPVVAPRNLKVLDTRYKGAKIVNLRFTILNSYE